MGYQHNTRWFNLSCTVDTTIGIPTARIRIQEYETILSYHPNESSILQLLTILEFFN